MTTYSKGLHEVGDRVFAYRQPDGGWGWSNAGLVADEGVSMLIDTLFDLRLTGEMLDTMRSAIPAAANIATVVNTHANGDHCFGNSLVADAEIVASTKCAEEMTALPPSRLAELMKAAPALGRTGEFVQRIFGPFHFEGIELAAPTMTFDGSLDMPVGDRTVRLLEVGPAHTAGDVIVHLPAEGVVFTGDIVFHLGHPIVWAGPVAKWIQACDTILALSPMVVVPGHGPIGNRTAVVDLRGYFEYLARETRLRFDAGMTPMDAARDLDMTAYDEWGQRERVAVNVLALYRDFGAAVPQDALSLLDAMAELAEPA